MDKYFYAPTNAYGVGESDWSCLYTKNWRI